MKPYLSKFQQLLNSIRADARLTGREKLQLLNMIEGYASAAAERARHNQRIPLPPASKAIAKKSEKSS